MKQLFPIALLLVGMIQQGCIDCGPQAELTARVYFSQDSLQLDSVYALKAVNQNAIAKQVKAYLGQQSELELPISMLADTTTYVFYFKDRIDTLSIYYERVFRYKGDCGFITDARKPSGRHCDATFSNVDVYYDTYARSGSLGFPFANPGTGISIQITL
ncbi:hypothetical protein [Dyadobacter sp. MSC1_007]|jgi:hypothetical protein|uniref:hypothetical protein n=1 Tax=Dyadobacter sp. MSC1_007 TaxID=2909264 RepID=UPI0020308455|nr:hypothetical protein [Dyadobacter sp. MSC1_007]